MEIIMSSRPAKRLTPTQTKCAGEYFSHITQDETKKVSVLDSNDWFEPIDYAPENKIVEVLEEDENNDDIRAYRNFDIDFDESSFSIWADL